VFKLSPAAIIQATTLATIDSRDLLAQTTPTKGPYWYHDGLGSVTDLTSTSGTSLWWTEYTPFGTPRASGSTSQAPTNLFRFTGAYLDTVTAFYHLRARQYDPTLGRFLSPDPLPGPLTEPAVGAYVYVRDNPVNLVDPSGQCVQSLVLALAGPAGIAVGGGLSTACVIALIAGAAAGEIIVHQAVGPKPRAPQVVFAPPPSGPAPGPPGEDPFNFEGRGIAKTVGKAIATAVAMTVGTLPLFGQNDLGEPVAVPRQGVVGK